MESKDNNNMSTEDILRQQIEELVRLVRLKDKRIDELMNGRTGPNSPHVYWDYTKIYCGSSTDGVTVTSNETNFTGLSDLP